jgi:diadenylate cyclase
MATEVVLPYGLGTHHQAGASISAVTDEVAIVVSESAMVRVFDKGGLIAEIIPELWLLSHHKIQLCGPYLEERDRDLAVLVQTS